MASYTVLHFPLAIYVIYTYLRFLPGHFVHGRFITDHTMYVLYNNVHSFFNFVSNYKYRTRGHLYICKYNSITVYAAPITLIIKSKNSYVVQQW